MIAPMRFYRFAYPDSTRGTAEWAPDGDRFVNVHCPTGNPEHASSKWRASPLRILLTQRRVQDILWTWFSEPVLQERVHGLFQEQGFTGYQVAPVQARFKRYRDLQPPKLHEVVVTGFGGCNTEKAGLTLLESCAACGMRRYRYKGKSDYDPALLIDESQWDGSDFFFVWPAAGYIFVTERVVELVQREKLTGVRLIPADEMERSRVGPVKDVWSVRGLRDRLPEPWASDIGKPLGIY